MLRKGHFKSKSNHPSSLSRSIVINKIQKRPLLPPKMLSAELQFCWCRGEGCSSGQLCFTHQIPWHTSLTCAQYDSQREHGHPDFQDTQEWSKANTKPCLGCGVDIEKHARCFHMTCRACMHEFCWTCLADWG